MIMMPHDCPGHRCSSQVRQTSGTPQASGVNNAVARVAGLLWIAALPPITGLAGAAYTDPSRFRSSFAQISWICAAAFTSAAALAAAFITRPSRPAPARPALIQTAVPHLACPIAIRHAPRQTVSGKHPRLPRQGREMPPPDLRATFCVQDQGQESRGQWWPGPHICDLAGCGPVFLAGRGGSAGGVAFPDLGDKGLDGGEGEVRAVAEDGVTCPGKSHQAGGAVRQLAN
jgi:hypothetical protein